MSPPSRKFYTLPKIAFIACGGTIGGEWSPVHDTIIPTKEGNKRLLEYVEHQIKLHNQPLFIDLLNKDSRAVTDKDREKIFKKIKHLRTAGIRHFLITHGTFTMVDTTTYLGKRCIKENIEDICIVLCGSMIPNTGFAPSDAQFNLGFALAKLSMLNAKDHPGAWVCMNGLLSRPASIVKNVKKARFQIKRK